MSDERLARFIEFGEREPWKVAGTAQDCALDLRDCRRKLADAERMVAAQSVLIYGMIGAFDKEGL